MAIFSGIASVLVAIWNFSAFNLFIHYPSSCLTPGPLPSHLWMLFWRNKTYKTRRCWHSIEGDEVRIRLVALLLAECLTTLKLTWYFQINISSPDPITRILYTPSLPPLTSIATRLRIYIDKYNFCSNAGMIYVAVLGYDMQRLNLTITLNSSPNTESIPKLFLNKRLGWPSTCVNLSLPFLSIRFDSISSSCSLITRLFLLCS